MIDRDIVSPGTIAKKDIDRFMAFETQDVQSTQFTFGVNATAIDFDTPGISQIDIQVTLNGLPNISVPQFSLVKLHSVDRAVALIPIQNAISSLLADVFFTVHHNDTSKADIQFNLGHQFIDNPILILQNKDIPQ